MPIDDDVTTAAGSAAQIARGIMQRLTGDRLEPVAYELEIHDLDGEEHQDWRVRRFRLSEGLSQCYEATLDLLNSTATANSDELLGQKVSLHISRAAAVERPVHGVIHRVDYIGITADNLMVRIHVVPAFRLLSHRVDCRIFQDQSVPEILQSVIEAGLGTFERELDMRGGLTPDERENNYPKRDYCVQYNESDLDFVTRLMEEEGITYFFEHDPEDGDGKKELLVLVDQVGDNPNAGCPEITIIDPDGSAEVPIIPDRPDTADTESIQVFDWVQPTQTSKVHARGFNWKAPDPESPPEGTAEGEDEDESGNGASEWTPELYLYGDRRKIVDDVNDEGFDGTAVEEFAESAVRRLELFKRHTQKGQGRSNVVNFSPGHWFKLREHAHDVVHDLSEFLLTRVIHSGDCPDVERQNTGSAENMGARYDNTFECIPRVTKFRPSITTPKPRIYGPQTATVTGTGNEEIHTDKFGRIKVRFHWDRVAALDDTASCWVRVAQSWAGPGWGTLFIPRVGMEVVVEFLEGNPDRPLVTGCVYNGRNDLPYDLPGDKTKSTIKTNSSMGGNGFNELRFEDAKGAEEVFLHAEKNYNEVVKNSHSTRVGADQSHTVGGDRTRVVKGSETITIEGNQTIIINGAAQDKGSDGSCGVTGKLVKVEDTYKLDTTNQILLEAPSLIKLTVKDSSITIEPNKITLVAGGGASITIDSDIKAVAKQGSKLFMTADIEASSNGKAGLQLEGGTAKLASSDNSIVVLDGDASVTAASGASVTLTADAAVAGATVTAAGKAGTVTADDAGVSATGPAVTIEGDSSVDISGGGATGNFAGGTVKLN